MLRLHHAACVLQLQGGKKQAGEHQLPHRLVPEEVGIVHVVGKTAVDQQAQVRGAVPVQVPQVGERQGPVRIREAVQAFIEVEPRPPRRSRR